MSSEKECDEAIPSKRKNKSYHTCAGIAAGDDETSEVSSSKLDSDSSESEDDGNEEDECYICDDGGGEFHFLFIPALYLVDRLDLHFRTLLIL